MTRQLVLEKENSEFKPVKLRLKIDLVSYLAQAEGLVNMDRVLSIGQIELNRGFESLLVLHLNCVFMPK